MDPLVDLIARVVSGYEPVREELLDLHAQMVSTAWYRTFAEQHVFTVPTRELLDEIADIVGSASAQRPVELFAGRGLLSAGLRRRGVPIEAYDATERSGVTRGDAMHILYEMRPDLVLMSWMPETQVLAQAIAGAQGVRTIIHLGNGERSRNAAAGAFVAMSLRSGDGRSLSYPGCVDAPAFVSSGDARATRDYLLMR